MTRPNFLYLGPDKAGSSWLHDVLIRHPQVFMPEAKDLYFFDRYYDRGLGWYLGQFRAAGPQHRVVGEVCQDYLAAPEAPGRIHASLGDDVRFMATLRDPAERAWSSYLYMLKHGEEPGTFLEALEGRPELLEHGRYGTQLQRYAERFGLERVHVAVFDDLGADPQAFVDPLLAWLGLDRMVLGEDLLAVRLPAGRARSLPVARAARWAAARVRELDGANLVGRVKRSPLVQRALYAPLADGKPVMSDEERAAVHDALAGEVALVDELTGLGLRGRWGWPAAAPAAAGPGAAPSARTPRTA
ncbi:sulfotransferase domain-containing protein [Vallicoccus soli]|uniref:sulfotransferase domain-containing protein n=1 Tax=Vallicoccus soli TaxID=2339232 RepID=UPI001402B9EE|nr:sulfotransferase domain-containing protein [Vallicoccus soli]